MLNNIDTTSNISIMDNESSKSTEHEEDPPLSRETPLLINDQNIQELLYNNHVHLQKLSRQVRDIQRNTNSQESSTSSELSSFSSCKASTRTKNNTHRPLVGYFDNGVDVGSAGHFYSSYEVPIRMPRPAPTTTYFVRHAMAVREREIAYDEPDLILDMLGSILGLLEVRNRPECIDASTQTNQAKLYHRDFLSREERERHDFYRQFRQSINNNKKSSF